MKSFNKDSITVTELDLTDFPAKVECESLTHWMPKGHKDRYDQLQSITNKRFGKLIKKLVMDKIDEYAGKLLGEQNKAG